MNDLRYGWIVMWYTGKKRNIAMPGNPPYYQRITKSFASKSHAEVDKKWTELKSKGYQISYMGQCIL